MVGRDSARTAWLPLALGLGLTPCVVPVVATLFSGSQIAGGLASAIVFAGGGLLPVVGLAIASACDAPLAFALGLAATGGLALLAVAHLMPGYLVASMTVDLSLVALGWALGGALGRRVQHASHLLPACVVAASADLASVLSPEGPSHAIARSERALSVLATWFPVPGAHAVAPALGVGDLVFMGLVFGVAQRHALPYARTAFLCLLGTALAGAIAAACGFAVPALPAIALCVLVGLPAARQLRPAERRTARWSMIIACSIALATIARNFLMRS
ncbi:MAG: hypothetical protein ABJB12_12490 [Pseudomonadota bacterium]